MNHTILFISLLPPLFFGIVYLILQRKKQFSISQTGVPDMRYKNSTTREEVLAHVTSNMTTPLTLARVPTDFLLSQPHASLPPSTIQMLNAIRHNLNRLEVVIHEVNMLKEAESLKFKTFHLPSYAAEIRDSFEPMFKSKYIRFGKTLDLEANTEYLQTDTLKFEKILLTMILHSFYHTPDYGDISLQIRTRSLPDGTVHLSCTVTDTGPVIPKEDLPYPGRWHYRRGPHQPGNQNGSSMLIHAGIAHAMGGSLTAASPESGGAAITLSVRCLAGYPNYSSNKRLPQSIISGQVPDKPVGTLHIVEDDQEIADMLQSSFEGYFEVYHHGTSEEFLHFATQHASAGRIGFDAILIDIMLPGMNGLELLHTIRQHTLLQGMPILMLSGNGVATNRQEAFRLGANAYITKPFDLPELRSQILTFIQINKLRHANHTQLMPALPLEASISIGQLILDTIPPGKKEWMRQILQIISEKIDDEQLSVPFLARQMAVSERQLFRLIKEASGLTPNLLILEIRLSKALQLLRSHPELSVSDIAQQVGIGNSSYFAVAFKKRFRKSPSEFR